ncbi:hypothetical protein [Vibrio vulnificus YJ016]|uniref:Uncharacterized protein n=2 Tax=Vibrio vulnificus TaxID=672 RepID=Q7MD72_VIBVY|nr:hypothetical protein FORC9_4011 [Vibrio vulnificus]BAC97190.1 hypothetical protein [Vibrio vulnificus YJ016]ANH65888.1 hypothetical protein FORC16_4005 [Vibrio vulnificus]ANN29111.1 hypothetical protein FORC17_4048 [Vibrio vulnificus]ASC59596.1 hypothetical protein FORC37_3902 [Vibrio vulnificus]
MVYPFISVITSEQKSPKHSAKLYKKNDLAFVPLCQRLVRTKLLFSIDNKAYSANAFKNNEED